MKKLFFYILSLAFILCNGNKLTAQCAPSSINLTTQAEVDAFPMNYPDCDTFNTIFIAPPSGVSDIVSLDSLIQATHIKTLIVRDNLIRDFEGLDNLDSVGQFSIVDNDRLQNFDHLSSLRKIRLFDVTGHDSIVDFSGMSSLISVQSFHAENNDLLEGFNGLQNCSIDGQLIIKGNDKIENLNNIGISDSLSILDIKNNAILTDITQLSSLSVVENVLDIVNNPMLSNCNIESICDIILETNGNVNIQNNDVGCQSISDLLSNCLDANDFMLTTQEEVDNFKIDNGCIDTLGMIIIGDPFNNVTTNIKSLDSLECVEHLTKHLFIVNNDSLATLDGLDNLKQIERSFTLESNKRLKNLLPLGQVDSIGRYIKIFENDSLLTTTGLENVEYAFDISVINNGQLENVRGFESIEIVENHLFFENNDSLNLDIGLDSLKTIGGDFEIDACYEINSLQTFGNLNYIAGKMEIYYATIVDFQGMEELDSIGGDFILEECDSLINMQGLSSLEKIGGGFELYYLYYKFQDFSGMGNLEYVGEEIYFEELYEVTSFTGLENLTYIGGDFILDECYVLTDITALDSLQTIGGDDLAIVDCYELAFCSVPAICHYIANSLGDIDIDSNNTGCATEEEIAGECMSCPNCYTSIDNTWLSSAVDTDWHNPANWSTGMVPEECHNVVIPTGNTVIIDGESATCFTLFVEQGAFLHLFTGYEFTIHCE